MTEKKQQLLMQPMYRYYCIETLDDLTSKKIK